MKNLTFIFLTGLMICIRINAFAQGEIIIENREKSFSVPENSNITVVTTDEQPFKGKYTIIDDSTMLINNDTLHLFNIQSIFVKSTTISFWSTIMIATGGLFGVYGGGWLLLAFTGWANVAFGILMAVPMIAASVALISLGIKRLSRGKPFHSTEWAYSINENIKNH